MKQKSTKATEHGIHLCGHAACLGGWCKYRETLHWGKNGFPFPSRCQLRITSWVGLGLHISFLFHLLHAPCCDCVCSGPVQALNMMSASVLTPCVTGRCHCLKLVHLLWLLALPLFLSPPLQSSRRLAGRLVTTSYIEKGFEVSTLCTLSSWGSLC